MNLLTIDANIYKVDIKTMDFCVKNIIIFYIL